jgi:hypothetical protein
MAKIDRLGWAAGTCIESYGVRVGVRTNAPEVFARLPALLPPGWKPSASPIVHTLLSLWVGAEPRGRVRRYNLLYTGAARRARSLDLDRVCETLEADLRLTVAAGAPRKVFVHAGVVGWRGRAIVLPGRSHAGKTTLVTELLRAGATYYSDEFAVLDGRGRVHPFPSPLSIREREGDGVGRRSAEDLGAVAGSKPLPIGLVAFSEYRRGARWRPVRLTPGKALLGFLAHTAQARSRTQASLAALQRVVVQASVLKGARGEAEEVAAPLLRQLEAPATATAGARRERGRR